MAKKKNTLKLETEVETLPTQVSNTKRERLIANFALIVLAILIGICYFLQWQSSNKAELGLRADNPLLVFWCFFAFLIIVAPTIFYMEFHGMKVVPLVILFIALCAVMVFSAKENSETLVEKRIEMIEESGFSSVEHSHEDGTYTGTKNGKSYSIEIEQEGDKLKAVSTEVETHEPEENHKTEEILLNSNH